MKVFKSGAQIPLIYMAKTEFQVNHYVFDLLLFRNKSVYYH